MAIVFVLQRYMWLYKYIFSAMPVFVPDRLYERSVLTFQIILDQAQHVLKAYLVLANRLNCPAMWLGRNTSLSIAKHSALEYR